MSGSSGTGCPGLQGPGVWVFWDRVFGSSGTGCPGLQGPGIQVSRDELYVQRHSEVVVEAVTDLIVTLAFEEVQDK
jgi:hypothetical protein